MPNLRVGAAWASFAASLSLIVGCGSGDGANGPPNDAGSPEVDSAPSGDDGGPPDSGRPPPVPTRAAQPVVSPLDPFTESARIKGVHGGSSITVHRNGALWTSAKAEDLTLDWSEATRDAPLGDLNAAGVSLFHGAFASTASKQALVYDSAAGDWILGTPKDGQIAWANVAKSSLGSLNDGAHVARMGHFTGSDRDEVLVYASGDGSWSLGAFPKATDAPALGALTFTKVASAPFANMADSQTAIGSGEFTGSGRTEVLAYDVTKNTWWLARVNDAAAAAHDGSMQWRPISGAKIDNLNDGKHAVWFGDFTESGQSEVLVYSAGDGNWWHGRVDSSGLTITLSQVGNRQLGDLSDNDHSAWLGSFTSSTSKQLLVHSAADGKVRLVRMKTGALDVSDVGSSMPLGRLKDANHVVRTGDFTGTGRTEIVLYSNGDSNWWRGAFDGVTLNWYLDGNSRGFGDLLDGKHTILIDAFREGVVGRAHDEMLVYDATAHAVQLGVFDCLRVPLPSPLVPGDKVDAVQAYASGEKSDFSKPEIAANNVDTQHYDGARTGWNRYETTLKPSNVIAPAATFQSRAHFSVSEIVTTIAGPREAAHVYAQPLYVHGIESGGLHDVLYVATATDRVVAFDGDARGSAAPLFSRQLVEAGEVPLDGTDAYNANCANIFPKIGITGTPVIDRPSSTMYVVSRSKLGGIGHMRLHALDLATLAERPYSPVELKAGDANFPFVENQRPGLALAQGKVFVAFGSHCDRAPYTGWVLTYDAATLNAVGQPFRTTDVGVNGAGIWQSGAAPAALVHDGGVELFYLTGNLLGTATGQLDEAAVKMSYLPGKMSVFSYVDPTELASLNARDLDFGSGGVTLLPGFTFVAAGKQGYIYLIDSFTMSPLQKIAAYLDSNGKDYVSLHPAQGPHGGSDSAQPGLFGLMAYRDGAQGGELYMHGGFSSVTGLGGQLVRFLYDPSAKRLVRDEMSALPFGDSTTVILSSDGDTKGSKLAWLVNRSVSPMQLVAIDTEDLGGASRTLPIGIWNAGTPFFGNAYLEPMVIDGKVFVGDSGGVESYSP